MTSHAFLAPQLTVPAPDLREAIARALTEKATTVTVAASAAFLAGWPNSPAAERSAGLGNALMQLLVAAVRDGQSDPQGESTADVRWIALDWSLSTAQLFAYAALIEGLAIDALAATDTLGSAHAQWTLITRTLRRASFDVLAAYTDCVAAESTYGRITHRLTTLYTRPIFEAALGKEVERAKRFGQDLSLILFDVDRLGVINDMHGYGVGDRVLERLGALIGQYFRQHDWAALHSEDSFAVLLPRTTAADADALAERVRTTVMERLAFTDATDRIAPVTVSAAVVHVRVEPGENVDPERLMAAADVALKLAKDRGRNRVEQAAYPLSHW
jgi:diguanylate cyclase (GGDEF)-like protein